MENSEGKIIIAKMYNNLCGFDDNDEHDLERRKIWKMKGSEDSEVFSMVDETWKNINKFS